jgi:hypothetical protein
LNWPVLNSPMEMKSPPFNLQFPPLLYLSKFVCRSSIFYIFQLYRKLLNYSDHQNTGLIQFSNGILCPKAKWSSYWMLDHLVFLLS